MGHTLARPAHRQMAALALLGWICGATAPQAASEFELHEKKKPERLEDRLVPIPSYSPDVANNGCRARTSPDEVLKGIGTKDVTISFWNLVGHAVGRYSVQATLKTPAEFDALIAPLDKDLRTLVLLYALWSGLGRDDLHTYFFMSGGAVAPAIRDALKNSGLVREHEAFTRSMAVFGDTYPVDNDARAALFGYSKSSDLNAFDLRLLAETRAFGDRNSFAAAITAYVNRTPTLWQRVEHLRTQIGDAGRLGNLTDALTADLDTWKPYAEIAQRLQTLSNEERTLAVVTLFNDELENGGIDQFFYNSEGAIAPEVYDALVEIGLDQQAQILKRALAQFKEPYERDTQRRRELYFHQSSETTDWDRELSKLTDNLYALDGGATVHRIGGETTIDGGPGIRYGMLKYAREKNLLPC